MPKITFMGAGSTIFAKNILGDVMLTPALQDAHIALYDIDGTRLRESKQMLDTLNANVNKNRARITGHLGVKQRKTALRGADFVVNAIQVGGYEPSTVIDFEIPKRYGLRQTIADTLGIGGIFRALRTIPVMLDFAREMQSVCPDAWMLNYTNPMPILSTAMTRHAGIGYVGLCHSVQGCAKELLGRLGMESEVKNLQWKIAGINHMAWLLEITDGGTDLYPTIKKRAAAAIKRIRKIGGKQLSENAKAKYGDAWLEQSRDAQIAGDMIRLELMRHFGYYVTESSEHNAEYSPYWIKSQHPGLTDEFNIPLDEYPRRCIRQIEDWKKRSGEIVHNKTLTHKRSHEYGSFIMEAMVTDSPTRIHGNVLNNGFIPNLPAHYAVEVPCLVDRNGVQGCHVGPLPEQLAGLNRTNINVGLLAVEAAVEGRKDALYHAAYLDPHTAAELPLDQIRAMVDEMVKAHGAMIPKLK